jgi:heat shock protein HslJ
MKYTATKTFIILAAFIVIGCASAFGQNAKLSASKWKLVEAEKIAVTKSAATIEFNSDLTGFSGNTGCNSMTGTLSVQGKKIDFVKIRTTERFCKLMAGALAEGIYTNALENAERYRLSGKTLVFLDRRGKTVLKFTRLVGDDPINSIRLEDKKWVLEQIKGRQTFVALPYAFVNFDAKKGSAGGDSSCNVFGGNYKVEGASITFSNIISTMRACIEDSKMAVERDMLDGLRDANRYEMRDGRLFLYRGTDLLLTFRGDKK